MRQVGTCGSVLLREGKGHLSGLCNIWLGCQLPWLQNSSAVKGPPKQSVAHCAEERKSNCGQLPWERGFQAEIAATKRVKTPLKEGTDDRFYFQYIWYKSVAHKLYCLTLETFCLKPRLGASLVAQC